MTSLQQRPQLALQEALELGWSSGVFLSSGKGVENFYPCIHQSLDVCLTPERIRPWARDSLWLRVTLGEELLPRAVHQQHSDAREMGSEGGCG